MKKIMKSFYILPLIVSILFAYSCSDEANAEKIAREFAEEIYIVDSNEIDSFNALMEIGIGQSFAETMKINDEALRALVTEDAYTNIVSNRQNLKYAEECSSGNYTMELDNLTLSKKLYDKKENKAGYDFEAKLKSISIEDKTEKRDTAKGYIGLVKENGKWKVSVYIEDK